MSDPGKTYIQKGTRISKISSEDVDKSAAIATFERDCETRLEILSRPKVPKILQELLSSSEELLSPRQTKLLKDSKRFLMILLSPRPTKLLKDSKRFQKNPKDSKRFQKIPKDSKRFLKIPLTWKQQAAGTQ